MVRVASRNNIDFSSPGILQNMKRSFLLYSLENIPENNFKKIIGCFFLFIFFVCSKLIFKIIFIVLESEIDVNMILKYVLMKMGLMAILYGMSAIFIILFYGSGFFDSLLYSLFFTIHSPIYYLIITSIALLTKSGLMIQITEIIGFLAYSSIINYLIGINIKVVLYDQREMLIEYIKRLFIMFSLVALIIYV